MSFCKEISSIEELENSFSSDPGLRALGCWSRYLSTSALKSSENITAHRNALLKALMLKSFTLMIQYLSASTIIFVHWSQHEPFLIRSDDPTKSGNDRFSGFIPDLLEALKEELDYSYTLMTPSDGKYGMKGSNGVWNGMVGMAQKNVRVLM